MNCSDLSSRIGHALLFIGNECKSWQPSQFADAAKRAQSLGFDGIVPKRADGAIKWYSNLLAEKQAVEAQSMKYVPFLYAYGPKLGNVQIERECAVIAEMQAVCDGIAVCDMEAEWNGNVAAAQYFVECMRHYKENVLIISTWGDPVQQNWSGVIQMLKPVVTAWWPQLYGNWLASQYHQYTDLGASCIQPTIDLSQEAGANDPVSIAKSLVSRGCSTISVWEYGFALQQEARVKEITAIIHSGVKSGGGNSMSGVPQDWHDDGTTLKGPNGVPILMGMRQYILTHTWDAGNVALCPEYHTEQVLLHNPSVGAGQVQLFRDGMLWYTDKTGVVPEPYPGMEIWAAYLLIDSLKTQLQQAKATGQPSLPDDIKAALKTLAAWAGTL